MSFGSVLGPVTGIVNFEGTLEQWRPTSSHPVHAAAGGMVLPGFGINAYSAEIGSVRITRFIRLDGVSADADRQMHGDPPGIPGQSPANPRPAPPAESPDVPWGPPGVAPAPGGQPGKPPAPAPVPGATPNPTPQPVGDPAPSQAPAPDPTPAPSPPGIPQRATPPAPTRSTPAQPVTVGRGATAGVFQPVPLADFATRLRETFPSFGDRLEGLGTFQDRVNAFGTFADRVVDFGTFGDRLRQLPETALERPGLLETGAIVGATGALLPIPRPAGAPLGTAIAIPQAVRNATTNAVSPPATITPNRPGPTAGGCRCNGPILSAISQMSGTPVGQTTPNPATGQAASLAAILTKLQQMQAFAEKAWSTTRIQKLIDLLTLVSVLHNAAFLSREIAETLLFAISNILSTVGIKDENDNPLDLNALLGQSIENFLKSVLGEDVYNDTRDSWLKANRIIQVGTSIIWTMRSMMDSLGEVVEYTAENTGKIGNALRRWGVVNFFAYGRMAERVKSGDVWRRRTQPMIDGLDAADDAVSAFAAATAEVNEFTEELNYLREQKDTFREAIVDFSADGDPDNSFVVTREETDRDASPGAEVTPADLDRPDP